MFGVVDSPRVVFWVVLELRPKAKCVSFPLMARRIELWCFEPEIGLLKWKPNRRA